MRDQSRRPVHFRNHLSGYLAWKKSTKYSDPTLLNEYDTYAFQISMHRMASVEIIETFGHIQELRGSQFNQVSGGVSLTRLILSTWGLVLT